MFKVYCNFMLETADSGLTPECQRFMYIFSGLAPKCQRMIGGGGSVETSRGWSRKSSNGVNE
ncbi:hypothetical protein OUZ56_029426 [Daphnia magna]|uniref:Uncharacterized protein n=1 Tax=Daphnia magna TaxID=35525 RepID=A0ABR0B6S2_9CRUS|nr:hypothetical protein OUZ56_029426 [Daphnia magna]